MKKILIIFIIVFSSVIFAQELSIYESENFIIKYNGSQDEIQDIINFSEELNRSFEELLRLKNSESLREILILDNYDVYTSYLDKLGIKPRKDYVYLKYSNNQNRVVIYKSNVLSSLSLAHQLTLQYIGFFGNSAPDWFNLGIATYFEDFSIESRLKRNFKWVQTLKRSSTKEKVFSTLMKNKNREEIKNYNSWLLVDYLINSDNKKHNRLFWDSLSILKLNKVGDNRSIINDYFLEYNLDLDLFNHLNSINGYTEYIKLGVDDYNNEDYISSIKHLKQAIELESKHYSPEYYLALCYSSLEDYSKAYSHFSTALDKGAPKNIVYYSIGINFYRNRDFDNAKKYLEKIEDGKYKVMAEKVIYEIGKY
ncbi:MAG: hypothetical protein OCD02_22295 [Spirochaetaceae bacterium]